MSDYLLKMFPNASVFIWCKCKDNWDSWITAGESREDAESNYHRSMRGRWPEKKPVYRVIVNRKMDADGYLLPREYGT